MREPGEERAEPAAGTGRQRSSGQGDGAAWANSLHPPRRRCLGWTGASPSELRSCRLFLSEVSASSPKREVASGSLSGDTTQGACPEGGRGPLLEQGDTTGLAGGDR